MIWCSPNDLVSQDPPFAAASGRRERDEAVGPCSWPVGSRAAVRCEDPADDLVGRYGVVFDLVVAAQDEEAAFGRGYSPIHAVRNDSPRRNLAENDVACAKGFSRGRFDDKNVAVAYERRHARTARGEANHVAPGKDAAGCFGEECRSGIHVFRVHGLKQ